MKYPVLLPRKHHNHKHHDHNFEPQEGCTRWERVYCQLFREFCILGDKCKFSLQKCYFKSIICRRLRGKLEVQKMADLPKETTDEAPSFTYCGLDIFGPILIKQKRIELKRYGIIFTCHSSRAVHQRFDYINFEKIQNKKKGQHVNNKV